MASIAKLKDRARKHEQKEDWQAAIEAYREVLENEEEADDLEVELGLYNRLGDLHLRLGQTDDAVSFYETAADKYAESGFFNNAIALCNKALRHRPDRPAIYLKLSRLCAEQGFQTDARRWILEYAERQMKGGRVEEALTGLEDFADLSADPEIRETLAQQLVSHDRPDEAVEQLRRAYQLRSRHGQDEAAAAIADRVREIDPSIDLEAEARPIEEPASEDAADEGWHEESWDEPGVDEAGAAVDETGTGVEDGLTGLETRREEPVEIEGGAVSGLEGLETTGGADGVDDEDGEQLSGLEVGFSEREPAAEPVEATDSTLGDLETFDAGTVEEEPDVPEEDRSHEEEAEPLPLLDTGYDEEDVGDEMEEEAEPLPLLDTGYDDEVDEVDEADEAPAEGELEPLSMDSGDADAMDLDLGSFDLGLGGAEPVQEEPDEDVDEDVDAAAILERAREMVSRGLTTEPLRELHLLSGHSSDPEVFRDAVAVVNEIIRHDANDVSALQRRVEFSAQTGDRPLLIEAYTDLADALARLGAETKARAMYERVLDLDAANAVALEALGRSEEAEEDTIDLDAVLREMEPEEMGVREAGGDDPGFAAMLSQFKAKVTDNVESDDAGDHYDLGLAFKEMGLIDEAIAEFQTALTGGTERLKVYEELGQCYIQKSQYTVALKVLNRALKVPHTDDSELLGVYYHLGQCHEHLGQRAEAREAYEKILDLDESFADVPDRVARL